MNRFGYAPLTWGGVLLRKEASTGLIACLRIPPKGGWRSGENLIVLTDAVGVIPHGN